MIRFRDFITEIFDKPLPHKKTDDPEGDFDHHYEFEHKGSKYHVGMYHLGDGKGGKHAEVSFHKEDPTNDPTKDRYTATKDSPTDSHKVFGTVKHILQKHAMEHKLKSVGFAGTGEPTRDKLYTRMAKKYGGNAESRGKHEIHYKFSKDK